MGIANVSNHHLLYLSDADLIGVGLLDYAAIVEDSRRGLSLHSRGETLSEKVALDFDVNRDWKVSALIGVVGRYAGVKWLGANTDNRALGLPRSSSLIVLSDQKTGQSLCVMDSSLISALRTGGCATVAAEVLGPAQPTTVGILGAGVISRCVLLCMATVMPQRIHNVLVYDRFPELGKAFASLLGGATGLPVEPSDDLGELVRQSGITVSATTAMEPLIRFADVRPGSLHVHLGGEEDERAYVVECTRRPNKLICDDADKVIHRNSQTVAYAYHEGLIRREDFYGDLGEILNGENPGREDNELIYFNAVGLPVLDIVVAARLYERARAENVGVRLESHPAHWIISGQGQPEVKQ